MQPSTVTRLIMRVARCRRAQVLSSLDFGSGYRGIETINLFPDYIHGSILLNTECTARNVFSSLAPRETPPTCRCGSLRTLFANAATNDVAPLITMSSPRHAWSSQVVVVSTPSLGVSCLRTCCSRDGRSVARNGKESSVRVLQSQRRQQRSES